MELVLVVPPFASAALPILGPSVLAAAARAAGIATRVEYANLRFAAAIGYPRYRRFALSTSRLHGEMLFREPAFDLAPDLRPDDFEALPDAVTPDDFEQAAARLAPWLDVVARRVAEGRPRVVGFSSVFQQNLASIALARAVRRLLPDAVLVLGGANAARPMGDALAEATDAFDLVVSGEADLAFVPLVKELLDGGRARAAERGPVLAVGPLAALDEAAVPDHSDYFDHLDDLAAIGTLPMGLPIALPFESSRGCWWGERSHCTFCGLNGLEMTQRDKSPRRVLDEIAAMRARHPDVEELRASDNILPFPVLRDVLPRLARDRAADLAAGRPPLRLFYEVKSAMRRAQLDLLAAAGVEVVQPGIESLSTDTLKRIAKGTTGPANVAFLRDAVGAGVSVLWNLMVGFPGDTREDYEALLRLAPQLEHLQPPVSIAPLRIDRYSPYFRAPEEYGIEAVRPPKALARVYPPGTDLGRLAYHFEATIRSPFRDDPVLGRRVTAAITRWHASWNAGAGRAALQFEGDRDVLDTRRCAVARRTTLTDAEADLLRRLDRARPWERVEEEADPAALSNLLHRCFVVQHEGKLVGVVVRPGPPGAPAGAPKGSRARHDA